MLEFTGMIAPERTLLELIFHQRYELFLARVYRHVASRLDNRRAIESLVERILAETLDDWMGPGEDVDRAIRVLARSRVSVYAAEGERAGAQPTRRNAIPKT